MRHALFNLCVSCCGQMDAYNLAIMFGPSLVRPDDDDMAAMLRDMNDQSQIVESLIRHVSRRLAFCFMLIPCCLFHHFADLPAKQRDG